MPNERTPEQRVKHRNEFADAFNKHPAMVWITGLGVLVALIVGLVTISDRLFSDPRKKIAALGLKWDNDDFSEAVRHGNLEAIKYYLSGKNPMSTTAYYGESDRYVINLPAFDGTENFPAIVELFTDKGITDPLKFDQPNKRSTLEWLFPDNNEPETVQDQLFITLATNNHERISHDNAKALIKAGASPQRVIDTSQKCLNPSFPTNYMGRRHCQEMLSFFKGLGYAPR